MLRRQVSFVGAVALAALMAAVLEPANADVIVFKDGFAIQGRVKEETTWFVDPLTGQGVSMPKSNRPFWLDDGVRNIYFPPFQLITAKADKTKKPDQVTFDLTSPGKGGGPMSSQWSIEGATKWDERWERDLSIMASGRTIKVKQRITLMTPELIRVETVSYDWINYFSTKEFSPETLRRLIYGYLDKKKESELDKRVKVYRFLLQAGFTEDAEQELNDMLRDFPKEKSRIDPLLDNVQRIYAAQMVESLQRADKAGLHGEVQRHLDSYAKRKIEDLLDEKTQLQVQAIKNKLEAGKEKLNEAKRLLSHLAEMVPQGQQSFFKSAVGAMTGELNADTLDRLETFLNLAADHERALKDKRKPEQTAAEIMAFALTGWLRGSSAAEPGVETAMKQWRARELLLEYLRADDPFVRKNKLLPALKAEVGVDDAIQFLRLLPPVEPFDQVTAKPKEMQTQNSGKQFKYSIQLPPGYHHGRNWPVLIALHHSREQSGEAVARWSALAAQYGYIVAAPQWGKGPKSVYQYSPQEHSAVLETLRDLRRRFQIDSDRVFVFGGEEGANMAFDVALSHPDQFAGVMPMSGVPRFFAKKYWSNAQFLHMYIINGQRAGIGSKETQAVFHDFMRCNFPAIYVEYKGRTAEWFGPEQPIIFDWMDRKRRFHPTQELGRETQEFKTQRRSETKFYWLSAGGVQQAFLNTPGDAWNATLGPGSMRAKVFNNNEIHINTVGLVAPMTLWFVPKMLNYNEQVKIRLNGAAPVFRKITPNIDTLLETLYESGDRQQLLPVDAWWRW